MSISVLVAIVGALVAAVGTGLLAGRCISSPGPSLIAWTVGLLALTIALLAQSIGFATGFGPLTFRVIQLTAQLVAPLWLAWGLVELVARGGIARFGAKLVVGALTIVVGAGLATDPLVAKPFGRTWPVASAHYQLIPHYALILVHFVAAVEAIAAAGICAARARGEPAAARALPGAAAVGLAVLLTVALRLSLPDNSAYPALSALSAGLVWFGMTRVDALLTGAPRGAESGSRLAGQDRGDPDGPRLAGQRGQGFPGESGTGAALGGNGFPGNGFPGDGFAGQGPGDGFVTQQMYAPGPGAGPAARALEAPGAVASRAPGPTGRRADDGGAPGADIARPLQSRPYGLIAIYTLLDDKVADFDRIAEQAAEQVRANEPDTLVYVIHTVPKAPMQRIFYEIYRDRAAFERHESQPYVKRFVTERRPCVLATNVIELRLKYAKVSPLSEGGSQVQGQAQGGAQVQPRAQGGAQVQGWPPAQAPQQRYGGI
ncbi:MAG TPA: antibiotic biosynthesis monooxygenase [Streptosporangiaceae bacterium]|jgi:quinol monooxygenase YgiN|nr:antibiotic biosynthesis monooxygenase [Streptosporangiaceae bacterium]